LAAKGRQLAAEKARSQGGAMGEAENIKTTVMNAPAAKNAIQDASVMEDLIKSNPKMPFGPWAKITNETLRVIHNVTGDKTIDAKSLAASDAVEKLNLSMAASMQQKWNLNPSSISLAQGSTPGNEKSRPGTLDLLGLIKQGMQRDYDVATKLYPVYAQAGKLSEFPQAVTDYYKEHPLQNPNTGHLVMDPIPVKSPADTKGLRPGTPIKLPDGRVGWVPNG
jgi:hypothetical protein